MAWRNNNNVALKQRMCGSNGCNGSSGIISVAA